MAIGDRYEVQQAMGEGGFSRVYLGQEKATGRAVALKVLKSAFYENAEVRERFQREVFAVASLSSPHIVGMYDFDLNSDDVYIAMEYVAGHTLRERMHDELTIAQRFSIIAQIAQAIGTAHERNVVHRDLKPENVKIVEAADGAVCAKVLDFGMAKLTELESRLQLEPLTRVGICFGTPQYMSPEQIRGKLDDKSIDLYALAIIAYELLTSQRPWDGNDPYEIMRAVLRIAAPRIECLRLSSGDEQLSAERLTALNAFFERALAKNLAERPRDAAELIEGLERALFGSIGAQPAVAADPERERRSDDTLPITSLTDTDRMWAEASAPRRIEVTSAQSVLSPTEPSVELSAELQAATIPMERLDFESRDGLHDVAREEMREKAFEAAASLQANRRAERSWKGLLIPLLVIAALGGSVGYALAGSASAQSNDIHDFVTK